MCPGTLVCCYDGRRRGIARSAKHITGVATNWDYELILSYSDSSVKKKGYSIKLVQLHYSKTWMYYFGHHGSVLFIVANCLSDGAQCATKFFGLISERNVTNMAVGNNSGCCLCSHFRCQANSSACLARIPPCCRVPYSDCEEWREFRWLCSKPQLSPQTPDDVVLARPSW